MKEQGFKKLKDKNKVRKKYFIKMASKEVYLAYSSFCDDNGYKPIGNTNLGIELKRLGYERVRVQVNNKREYYYRKIIKSGTASGYEMAQ